MGFALDAPNLVKVILTSDLSEDNGVRLRTFYSQVQHCGRHGRSASTAYCGEYLFEGEDDPQHTRTLATRRSMITKVYEAWQRYPHLKLEDETGIDGQPGIFAGITKEDGIIDGVKLLRVYRAYQSAPEEHETHPLDDILGTF